MGQSSVPKSGYPRFLESFANDLLGLLDQLDLPRVHLIGETVGGSIAMRFAILHQDRLLSLAVCTSPVTFDAHHTESAATPAHVVSEFQRRAPGNDLRPLLPSVKTPTLVLAAAHLREEVLGDCRSVADLFPDGRSVMFPGVSGFVQHILPVPCTRVWLEFANSLGQPNHT